MSRPWIGTIAVLASVALAACGPHISAARVSPARYAPVPADSVYVYSSPARVPARYVEVAMLDGKMSSSHYDADMIKAMRKKAGELGANAIILSDIHHPSSTAVAATGIAAAVLKEPGLFDVPTRANAIAIRIGSDSATKAR